MNGIEGVKQITRQMVDLLNQIDEHTYATSIDLFDGSSLGKHFRHIYDFYTCLIAGIENGFIDYSSRERDERIESYPQVAAQLFQEKADQLTSCSILDEVTVLSDFSNMEEEERESYCSTIGRELAFIHDHAVHHLAIIRMGLKIVQPTMVVSKGFGVAPSTLKFQQKN